MRSLLDANTPEMALAIGNGINRNDAAPGTNSWEDLLPELARRHINPAHSGVPKGVSPPEFYDVLDLAIDKSSGDSTLQAQFCQQMADWTGG